MMNFIKVQTLTVRREFRPGTYEWGDGTTTPCWQLTRDCSIGCTCEASILHSMPGPELAETNSLCFDSQTKQGISEVKGTAKAIKEGPDEWIYELIAEVVQAQDHPV